MHEGHACVTRKQHFRRRGPACPLRYAHSYPGRPDQLRLVRACLRQVLGDWPRTDDAVLVASELAANSVLHSRSGRPGGVFTVRAEVHRGAGTCIAVQDQGGAWDFRTGEVRPEHGLDVVQGLAGPGNWGVGGDSSGRIVWARLLWPPHTTPPHTMQPDFMPPDFIRPSAPAVEPRDTVPPDARMAGTRLLDPRAADDVLADLDRLATELAALGVQAHLVIPGGNRTPHLAIRTAVAGLAERVYAQADWFLWPTSERIASRDDVRGTAVAIADLFIGPLGAPRD